MELSSEQKDFLNECINGTWELNPEGLVDVRGNFYYSGQNLSDFKGIRFGRVGGDFYCSFNDLITLQGAPQTIGGDFSCQNNNLTSLKGAPQTVGGYFSCSGNDLTSLEGAPQTIGGSFYCHDNKLTTLKGAPQEVGESFWCSGNNLITLKGAPQTIGSDFYCRYNKLMTLKGAPQAVGGNFSCHNNNLTTLEGAPQTIKGKFDSDHVDVPQGQWSLQTLIEIYRNSAGQRKELLGTLVSPEALQKRIDANPERAAVELKSIVSLPEFKGLRWPESLKSEIDLLSDLDSVGL